MRSAVVAAVVLAGACTEHGPQPIATINPVLGDTSFLRTFGRFPTAADDARVRVQTHVSYVARLLRARDVSQLTPIMLARRTDLLDELDRYVAAGQFPDSETEVGLLPTFLDAHSGVRCAVADLVEYTAGTAAMAALDRDHHNDYIADLEQDARFEAWAASSGFTAEELEMIQPSYPGRTFSEPPEVGFGASYAIAVDDRSASTPFQLGLADLSLRHVGDKNHYLGTPLLELDGALGVGGFGMTVPGDRTPIAYDLAAKVGSRTRFYPRNGSWHEAGWMIGINVDRYGERIARAVTIPLDGWYQFHVSHDTLLGIHGGPRVGFGDRGLGWTAGLDTIVRDLFVQNSHDGSAWTPRDLTLSVGVTQLAELTFVGASLAFGMHPDY